MFNLENTLKCKRKIVFALFIFCFSLILTRAYFIHFDDNDGGRSFIFGDGYSDINTYSAIRYFHQFGFLESNFRPMHVYSTPEQKKDAKAYTHYPALPDVLMGGWSVLTNSENEFVMRLFPMLLSVFFFFFIFYFLDYWLPNENAAFISGILLVISNYFIAWADTFHKHTFEEVFKWLFVHGILYFFLKRRSLGLLVVLFAASILYANISFEVIVFFAAFSIVMSAYFESGLKKILSPMNVSLGLGFVLGFALHFYLNMKYYGDFQLAKSDLWGAFLERTNQCDNATICGMTLLDYIKMPLTYLSRIERFYIIPGFAVVYLAYLALSKMKTDDLDRYRIGVALLVASLSWAIVMKQHAWVHVFTCKQSGIFWAWISGYGIVEYIEKYQRGRSQLKYKILHYLFLFYVLGMFVTQQVKDLYWDNGFSRIFS